MSDRAAILIDGGYLDAILRSQFSSALIDYAKLPQELSPDMPVLRTYYYTCEPWQSNPATESESKRFASNQRFLNYLQQIQNYEVRLGRLAFRGIDTNGQPILEQKEVDILLTVELLRLSMRRSIARAILITGDSDFVPAIRLAKDEGVEIYLAHGSRPHLNLITSVDKTIRINSELINKIRKD